MGKVSGRPTTQRRTCNAAATAAMSSTGLADASEMSVSWRMVLTASLASKEEPSEAMRSPCLAVNAVYSSRLPALKMVSRACSEA